MQSKEKNYNFFPFKLSNDRQRITLREGNKVVVENKSYVTSEMKRTLPPEVLSALGGWYCGYVLFNKWEVPFEWWGDYDAGGLQYLNIHGGITYCEVRGNGYIRPRLYKTLLHIAYNIINYISKFTRSTYQEKDLNIEIPQLNLKIPKLLVSEMRWWSIKRKIDKWLSIVFGDYVIFGFDCNHGGDDTNPDLHHPEVVMDLTTSMERQLKEYKLRYKEWKKADTKRKWEIIDEIAGEGTEDRELGTGAILDVLSGGNSLGYPKEKEKKKKEEVGLLKRMWKKTFKKGD